MTVDPSMLLYNSREVFWDYTARCIHSHTYYLGGLCPCFHYVVYQNMPTDVFLP